MCVPEVLINESGDGIIVKKKINGEDYEINVVPDRSPDADYAWYAEQRGYIIGHGDTIHEAIESAVNNIKSR